MNEAVNSTMFQISSSCFEWWSSFVCSLRFDLFHEVFERYTLCLEKSQMRLWIAPSIRSRRAVSGRGLLLSVAYELTRFLKLFDSTSSPLPNGDGQVATPLK